MELWRQKNASTYISFPMVDVNGDPVSSISAFDSEYLSWSDISIPCSFTDCNQEAISIAAGIYFLKVLSAD